MKYIGFFYLADAVQISIDMGDVPVKVTKDIYPELATKYHTKDKTVELNIRTVRTFCWQHLRKQLEEAAGFPLESQPTNSEFIDIMTYYIKGILEKKAREEAERETTASVRTLPDKSMSRLPLSDLTGVAEALEKADMWGRKEIPAGLSEKKKGFHMSEK